LIAESNGKDGSLKRMSTVVMHLMRATIWLRKKTPSKYVLRARNSFTTVEVPSFSLMTAVLGKTLERCDILSALLEDFECIVEQSSSIKNEARGFIITVCDSLPLTWHNKTDSFQRLTSNAAQIDLVKALLDSFESMWSIQQSTSYCKL
jgi:hypothetical protein